jgi:integrase
MAQGWFRRPKGKLVYVWQVEDPKTGRKLERAKVIGDATLSDEVGWQILGRMKAEGRVKAEAGAPSEKLFFSEVASFYLLRKEWKKLSTKKLHEHVVNDILVARWGDKVAVKIEPPKIKAWLKSLVGENGTRYKFKTVMGTLYTFAQSEGLLPLGEQYNPVHYVKGIESMSDYEAAILTPEQTLRVLEQLQQPEYTMLVLVAATGMRMSEMLGLRWSDISEDRGEIRIRRTYVYGELETGAKTRLSKSTVAMHHVLGQLLKEWRTESAYASDDDFVFASRKLMGREPRRGSMVVADHLKPAALRAGVIEVKEGNTYIGGELVKQFGFHTFRHSLTSWLMANGENPQIVRAMLRWTNLNMLSHYTHGFKADKLEAQGAVLGKLVREPDAVSKTATAATD